MNCRLQVPHVATLIRYHNYHFKSLAFVGTSVIMNLIVHDCAHGFLWCGFPHLVGFM